MTKTPAAPHPYLTPDIADPLERVRATRAAAQDAVTAFECAVDEAVAAGCSLRVTGAAAGLTHTGVAKLVERLWRTGRPRGLERERGRWLLSPPGGRAERNLPPYDR